MVQERLFFKEKFMSKFLGLEIKTSEIPISGVLLWIFHASKIPPHIGISSNGHYFSLKFNGKDKNLSVEHVLKVVRAKKIETVIIELNTPISIEQIENQFSKFDLAKPNEATCLTPITQFFDYKSTDVILSELLEKIQENKFIHQVFGLHLEAEFSGISNYSRTDIQQRLKKLHDSKRETH